MHTSAHPSRPPRGRPGFTLVEMLVVLVIVLFLSTLAVALVPRLGQRQRVASGADLLQGWLLVARQRALRDQLPTGLRLQPDNSTMTGSATPVPAAATDVTIVPDAMSGISEGGWTWSIQPGCMLVIEPDIFLRMEVVRVKTVSGTSFTADFTKAHPDQFKIHVLAFVKDVQYVQQPDDFRQGKITVTQPSTLWVAASDPSDPVDFAGGYQSLTQGAVFWPVQPGDYLELKGGGLVHLITGVGPQKPDQPSVLTLQTGPLNPITVPTGDYRIIRSPRPLAGEPPLQLPADVAIDLTANYVFGGPPLPLDISSSSGQTLGNIDILFAPSGAVVGRGTAPDRTVLWVRDMTLDTPLDGEPCLLTVQTRTGHVAAHPVDESSTDKFTYTKDGRSSGL